MPQQIQWARNLNFQLWTFVISDIVATVIKYSIWHRRPIPHFIKVIDIFWNRQFTVQKRAETHCLWAN